MNDDKIKNIIKKIEKYREDGDFTGGVTLDRVYNVESKLNVTLPDSYKWFLTRYGHGGVLGIEMLGCALRGIETVVEETIEVRQYGLKDELIVIENVDEYVRCLDTRRIENGDCPVVSWGKYDNDGVIPYTETFLEYLEEELDNEIDNI